MPPPLKLSQIPAGVPTANTLLVGVETTGITSIDYQYPIGLLAAYINGLATGIVANVDSMALVSSATTMWSYVTPAAIHTYSIGGYVNIASITAANYLTFTAIYTDENGIPQSDILPAFDNTGAGSGQMGAAGVYSIPTVNKRVLNGTAIRVDINLTGGGSVHYDAGATLRFII